MPIDFERLWVLLILPLAAVAVVLLAWPTRHQRGTWLAALLRLMMLGLLFVAMAGPVGLVSGATAARRVVLVDRSASGGEAALAAVQPGLAGLAATQTLVVQFAERPELVSEPNQSWPSPAAGSGHGTDLEAALRLALELARARPVNEGIDAGQSGSVLLVSDGLATTGNALHAAELLAEAGVRVDIREVTGVTTTQDAGIEAVEMPAAVWARDPFSVTLSIYAAQATPATVSLQRDGYPVTDLTLDLQPGENHVALSLEADSPGLTAIEARVTAKGDGRPQNDQLGAIALVRPSPSALVVAHTPESGAPLQAALSAHDINAVMADALRLPAKVDGLLPYQLIVLENISAEALSVEQLAALKAYVYGQGGGLIVFGGPSAYTLGAYRGTALEDLLPIKLEPPTRSERPPASLLLILDHSESMRGLKLQLVKEAAMRAVEIMRPGDQIGVLAFNDKTDWSVPLSVLGSEVTIRQVLDGIGAVEPTGGTNILQPLQEGIEAMLARPRGQQHIVLLTDGISTKGEPPEFQELVERALASNITISSIAVGQDADSELLAQIAQWGQGRFRLAIRPADIPRMMVAESQYAAGDMVQRGLIQPQIVMAHALVNNFDAADFPPLSGHIALLPKPVSEADTVLVSPLGDPLLAAWQYGLGRVVAWTGDAALDWSPKWAAWDQLDRFWLQMVRYAFPDPTFDQLLTHSDVHGTRVELTVLANGPDSRGINLGEAALRFFLPDGSSAKLVLPQMAPGEYAMTFDAPLPGAYRGVASLDKDGQHWEVPVGFVVGYSPEYSPRLTSGGATLRQIAALTGGEEFGEQSDLALTTSRVDASGTVHYAGRFVLAALLLWPVEIAVRRRWRPWR